MPGPPWSHQPCTGARWRNSPLDGFHGRPRRGANPPLALTRRVLQALPARQPSWFVMCSTTRWLWKLPELWTHRTRPQVPWKPQNGFHSFHSHRSFPLREEKMINGTGSCRRTAPSVLAAKHACHEGGGSTPARRKRAPGAPACGRMGRPSGATRSRLASLSTQVSAPRGCATPCGMKQSTVAPHAGSEVGRRLVPPSP
jgi:hypothetical protein